MYIIILESFLTKKIEKSKQVTKVCPTNTANFGKR